MRKAGRVAATALLSLRARGRAHLLICGEMISRDAERDLRSARLAMVARETSDALVFYDKKGKITDWNRGAQRLYGWSEAEACKLSLADLSPGSAWRRERGLMRRLRRSRKSVSFESVRKTKAGSLRDVALIWVPLRDEAGKFAGLACIGRDITDQKRAESKRLETLVEGAPSASLVVDDAGRIVLANRKSAGIFGFKAGQLVGRKVDSLLPPRLRAGHPRHRHDFLRAPKPVHMGEDRNLRAARRDGELFPVEVSLIPVTYHGRRAVMAHIVDISERRQAHEAEALRHKEAMHRDFVANASHELRTPVAAIKGFAEALHGGALADPKTGPKFLRIIEENADQLARMVDDLLELSALESGLKGPRRSRVCLRRLVLKETEGLSELARRKDVSLRARVDSSLRVGGNPVQLQHVLQNLVENAIQYNRPRGFVEVSARRAGSEVRVRVRDSGIGIPKGQLDAVFERFHRTKRAAARVVRGTGLGLPIAKAIVESHGGRIWAENVKGRGTDMFFTLPAAGKAKRS